MEVNPRDLIFYPGVAEAKLIGVSLSLREELFGYSQAADAGAIIVRGTGGARVSCDEDPAAAVFTDACRVPAGDDKTLALTRPLSAGQVARVHHGIWVLPPPQPTSVPAEVEFYGTASSPRIDVVNISLVAQTEPPVDDEPGESTIPVLGRYAGFLILDSVGTLQYPGGAGSTVEAGTAAVPMVLPVSATVLSAADLDGLAIPAGQALFGIVLDEGLPILGAGAENMVLLAESAPAFSLTATSAPAPFLDSTVPLTLHGLAQSAAVGSYRWDNRTQSLTGDFHTALTTALDGPTSEPSTSQDDGRATVSVGWRLQLQRSVMSTGYDVTETAHVEYDDPLDSWIGRRESFWAPAGARPWWWQLRAESILFRRYENERDLQECWYYCPFGIDSLWIADALWPDASSGFDVRGFPGACEVLSPLSSEDGSRYGSELLRGVASSSTVFNVAPSSPEANVGERVDALCAMNFACLDPSAPGFDYGSRLPVRVQLGDDGVLRCGSSGPEAFFPLHDNSTNVTNTKTAAELVTSCLNELGSAPIRPQFDWTVFSDLIAAKLDGYATDDFDISYVLPITGPLMTSADEEREQARRQEHIAAAVSDARDEVLGLFEQDLVGSGIYGQECVNTTAVYGALGHLLESTTNDWGLDDANSRLADRLLLYVLQRWLGVHQFIAVEGAEALHHAREIVLAEGDMTYFPRVRGRISPPILSGT
jgi:hypothetical protein